MTIEGFIFYLLLLDSLTANAIAWWGEQWYSRHFRVSSRLFPVTKPWALYYLVLVLWIGSLLYRAGALGF